MVLDADPDAANEKMALPSAKALNPGEMRDDEEVMQPCGLGEKNGLAQGEIATVVSTPRNATPHPRPRTFSSDLVLAKE